MSWKRSIIYATKSYRMTLMREAKVKKKIPTQRHRPLVDRVADALKITGGIILVGGFIAYHTVYQVSRELADILYWLPNMIGVAVTFFAMGLSEKSRLVRELVYYPVSYFFAVLAGIYLIDRWFDQIIEINKIILTLIIIIIICLLCFFYKKLRTRK